MLSFLGNTVGDDGVEVSGQLDLSTKSVSWQDIPFSDLQTVHFEQILWEMAEINFRFEFQALDCWARTGTPYEDQPESEIMLMCCFPDQSFAVPSFSAANHGIASLSSRERAHYLFALARVMARWKSVNPNGLIVQTGQ